MLAAGNAANWIKNQPMFSELSPAEQNEAGSFSFICTMFELNVMQALGKDPAISSLGRATCREYAQSQHLPKNDLSVEKAYFRNRFFDADGQDKKTWDSALFRPSDSKEEIKEILLNYNAAAVEDAEALIRIVVRLRNNYFHGFKWAYKMKDQLENFVHANSVLVKVMPNV